MVFLTLDPTYDHAIICIWLWGDRCTRLDPCFYAVDDRFLRYFDKSELENQKDMLSIDTARSWYTDTDPVHGFDHVLRVYRLAEKIAQAEGADIEIVRAAALLHDADGSATEGGDEGRLEHHQASAAFARKILEAEDWAEDRIAEVEHCIRAHRFRDESEQPQTLEAKVLYDSDKLDVIGAIGVARTIAYDVVWASPSMLNPRSSFWRQVKRNPVKCIAPTMNTCSS
jgi:uncharacterized protein